MHTGKTAWSQIDEGSWFVKQLCEVVYNNNRDLEDLDTIMLRVGFLPRHLLLQNNLPETGSPRRWLKNGTDSRPLVMHTCQKLPKADFVFCFLLAASLGCQHDVKNYHLHASLQAYNQRLLVDSKYNSMNY